MWVVSFELISNPSNIIIELHINEEVRAKQVFQERQNLGQSLNLRLYHETN